MEKLEICELRVEGRESPLGVDAALPVLGWTFAASTDRSKRQIAYRVVVASHEEELEAGHGNVWDCRVVESGKCTDIVYAGAPLTSRQRYYWLVQVWDESGQSSESTIGWWEMGLLSPGDWTGSWIGQPADTGGKPPMPQFRREFTVYRPVKRARAYISGLGHYELRLNGSKVGCNELDPGWTNYDKTCLYTVYDVTTALQQGDNAVGIVLGNGFYNVTGGRYTKFKDTFGAPKCLLNLAIDYDDGTSEIIYTDRTWSVSPSPLTFSCIYGGEDYDARLEQPGWDNPGFSGDAGWTEAFEVEAPLGTLRVQTAPPLKVMKRFLPVDVKEPRPGTYMIDLGQNFSGWPEIKITGRKGAVVTLLPAELLTSEGLSNQRMTGAPYQLNYVLKGEGVETWRPKFTYYGFRYVQVEGAVPQRMAAAGSDTPVLLSIEGQMIYPDTKMTGSFRCSDEMLNRIHEIIDWSILSNMKSVFTDCPHREKLGWLEEVHLMGPSIMYNFDIEAMLSKVMVDIEDAQLPNGMVPTTAPEYVVFKEPWHMFRDAAAWGGTYILSAWEMLQRYGNRGILERHYEGMKRYVEYLTAGSDGFLIRQGLGDWYDIGPEGPGFSQNTPVPLAETAIYYGLVVVMQKIARLLGHSSDAESFGQLGNSIKTGFNEAFFDPQTKQYATGSDAAQAMPLVVGLVEEEHRSAVLRRLVDNMTARGYQTTSGDVGHRYVLLALARGGRSDVIFRTTRNTETPGYGYQIVHGATTLTEAWDGPTIGKSQNHFMLGHLEEWLYSGLAGLDYRYVPESERFTVTVKPYIPGDLAWAEAWCDVRAGRAGVRWERGQGNTVTLNVDIPVNANGVVYVPAAAGRVTENGREIGLVEDVELLRYEDGYAVIRTGSGTFTFAGKLGETAVL